MPSLTVRDIPEELYERLRERAGRQRRSMSAEIITLIEEALTPRRHDAEDLIAEAKSYYEIFPEPLPDLTSEAKREGRK